MMNTPNESLVIEAIPGQSGFKITRHYASGASDEFLFTDGESLEVVAKDFVELRID